MKKLLISFGFLLLIIGSFFIFYKIHSPVKISAKQSSINNDTNKKNIIKPIPIASKLPQPSSITTSKKTSVIYNILGTSIRPKIYPNAALTKWRKVVVDLAKKYPSDIYVNGQTENKVIALTFDDGPDPVNTPKIIKILRNNNIEGTFLYW